MSRWETERRELYQVVQRMADRGLVLGASGNASLCLERKGHDQGLVMITPTQLPYSQMVSEDLVVIDFQGDPVEGELVPSSETGAHLEVYRARRDVNAVVHTHSVYASVLAVAGLDLPPILDELVVTVGGTVKVAEYGFPGSEELAREACLALGDRKAVLLRNHGLLGTGSTAQEALQVCELVERAAEIFLGAFLLGKVNLLSRETIEAERSIYQMRLGQAGGGQELTR